MLISFLFRIVYLTNIYPIRYKGGKDEITNEKIRGFSGNRMNEKRHHIPSYFRNRFNLQYF